jgi:tetratricopeptide (TPR) repeat protein
MIRTAAVLVLALACPALADDLGVPEKAKRLAERGRELHDAGDYVGAIAAYKEAYVLAPRPGLLFNLAQAYRLSGDCDDAAFMYRRFLDSDPPAERRTIAESNLATVMKCGHGGLEIAMPVAATTPTVSVTAPTMPAPSTSHLTERVIGGSLVLGGAAALVVAGVFAFDAHEDSNAVTQAYANGVVSPNLSQQDASGRRDATIAEACGIVGGAATITGAILFALGARDEARHVAVVPSLHGGEVRVSWGF